MSELLNAAKALILDADDRGETCNDDGELHFDWKALIEAVRAEENALEIPIGWIKKTTKFQKELRSLLKRYGAHVQVRPYEIGTVIRDNEEPVMYVLVDEKLNVDMDMIDDMDIIGVPFVDKEGNISWIKP